MNHLFTRMKNTIAADFHDLIDKKERKNPIALLNQYFRQCEKETEKVGQLVERHHLLKSEFEREHEQALHLTSKRKHQSEVAEQAADLELMEIARQEWRYYEERAVYLSRALENATSELKELERKHEEMKRKLKDMHVKRMELMGRENMVRASGRISRVLETDEPGILPGERFAEMETYLDRVEKQVNAAYDHHTIDARIAEIEKKNKQSKAGSISS